MPLVKDATEARDVFDEVRGAGARLPAFCAEDERTQKCILAGALEKSQEMGVKELPVVSGQLVVCFKYPGYHVDLHLLHL